MFFIIPYAVLLVTSALGLKARVDACVLCCLHATKYSDSPVANNLAACNQVELFQSPYLRPSISWDSQGSHVSIATSQSETRQALYIGLKNLVTEIAVTALPTANNVAKSQCFQSSLSLCLQWGRSLYRTLAPVPCLQGPTPLYRTSPPGHVQTC